MNVLNMNRCILLLSDMYGLRYVWHLFDFNINNIIIIIIRKYKVYRSFIYLFSYLFIYICIYLFIYLFIYLKSKIHVQVSTCIYYYYIVRVYDLVYSVYTFVLFFLSTFCISNI